MAPFHFKATIHQRSMGHNSIGSAAYRSGTCMGDSLTGQSWNSERKKEVRAVFTIDSDGKEVVDRESMFEKLERKNTRLNAQLGRDFEFSLPRELSFGQQLACSRDFAMRLQGMSDGMAIDAGLHDKDDGNPHCHMWMSDRYFRDGEWGEKNRDINSKDFLREVRRLWADVGNEHLMRAGFEPSLDERSFIDQGIDHAPGIHVGRHGDKQQGKVIENDRRRAERKENLNPQYRAEFKRDNRDPERDKDWIAYTLMKKAHFSELCDLKKQQAVERKALTAAFSARKKERLDREKDSKVKQVIRMATARDVAIARAELKAKHEQQLRKVQERPLFPKDFNEWREVRDLPIDRGARRLKKGEDDLSPRGIRGLKSSAEIRRDFRQLPDGEWKSIRVAVLTYTTSDNKPALVDYGDRVAFRGKSEEAVLAGLQLSAAKWGGGFQLSGNDKFKSQALDVAVKNGLAHLIRNPELQQEIQNRQALLNIEKGWQKVFSLEDASNQLSVEARKIEKGLTGHEKLQAVFRDVSSLPALAGKSLGDESVHQSQSSGPILAIVDQGGKRYAVQDTGLGRCRVVDSAQLGKVAVGAIVYVDRDGKNITQQPGRSRGQGLHIGL